MSKVNQTGYCKFCKQGRMFEAIGEASQERLDEWATEKCDCKEGEDERAVIKMVSRAKKNVEKMFGSSNVAGILNKAITPIAHCEIGSVGINIGNGTKVDMYEKGGKILIIKTTTEKETLE